ncbi:MAG: isoleucine--tRNA ligase [Gemmatimonadaceae bacterium]
MTAEPRFAPLSADRGADEVEREVLERWVADGLFARTIEANAGRPSFVFFEGPPTANGRPGIHHVFARTIKDLFCRYRAMRGFDVARKAGWDTHGLPVEIEVEKELAKRIAERDGLTADQARRVSGKQLIEAYGVAEFNRLCRESVWRYQGDWERLSERMGYWLDYEHAYVTYSNDYVESVWWALKTLFERGLLYQGHKILPYCARCGTALSSHEVAQGYEEVTDPSVYIALDLEAAGDGAHHSTSSARRILVWTTTPWTLVANVALAVHPDLEYVEVTRRSGDDRRPLILAASRLAAVLGADWEDRWVAGDRMPGTALVGRRYRRPLDWVAYPPGGVHEVVVGERFVSADDGTGVVHMAPAFGADDFAAGKSHGFAFLQPVDTRGEFPADLPLVGGRFVKDADAVIIEELKRRGVLWKATTITHPYPHCWRCSTPLLYYARNSWFLRTTALKEDMLRRNAAIEWHAPEIGTGRFGEWLKNNIDWAISRDRYWGTPLPIWRCDREEGAGHVEAIGSYAELHDRSGMERGADFDPHKPYIDAVTWACAACSGTMRRVPEVIDAWFDSGSMPFAQWHYPFDNREVVERQFPADLIAEGVDQTRGWFYSLLAIASGLGEALPHNRLGSPAPYKAVVVNDLVLDATGKKMSKTRGNAVDPWAMMERHGADAVRLFLVAASDLSKPRNFDEAGIREVAGRFLRTWKNVYTGIFAQYANFGWSPSAADPMAGDRSLLDRWILARLAEVESRADALMTAYDATAAAREIIDFVDGDLSNWFVRLSRNLGRFYDVDGADNRAAFATLHESLVVVCRLVAPIAPFVSDWMHRSLTGESVHLAPYVRQGRGGGVAPVDAELLGAMRSIRKLAQLGRAARDGAGLKVRQPLGRVVCVVPSGSAAGLEALFPLLADELNVKRVELAASGDALVTVTAKANFRALGKKFGSRTKDAAASVQALPAAALAALERGESVTVTVGGESHAVDRGDVTIVRRAAGSLAVAEDSGYVAALDPEVTPALRREGVARELARALNDLRKQKGLAVSDRVRVVVRGDEEVEAAANEHRDWIAGQVLARDLVIGGEHNGAQPETVDLDGPRVAVVITRVE